VDFVCIFRWSLRFVLICHAVLLERVTLLSGEFTLNSKKKINAYDQEDLRNVICTQHR
jgi:hypothetical protein